MTFEVKPYPEFAWSISRQRKLDQCPRAYFFSYYLHWNGWLDDAPTEARVAYRLGKLTSLDALLGQQIDVRARELETTARTGALLPEADELETRTREALRQFWTRSRNGRLAFEARPSKVTMLRSLYMDQDTRPETDRLKQKAGPSMKGLLATSHWERLRARGEDGRVEVPDFASFAHDGIKVFAAPDLAYVAGGVLHIVDWKTGRADDTQATQVLLQMWWALETYPRARGASRSVATWSMWPPARRRRSRLRPAFASRPPRPCAPASPGCARCWPTRSRTSRLRSTPSSAARAASASTATSPPSARSHDRRPRVRDRASDGPHDAAGRARSALDVRRLARGPPQPGDEPATMDQLVTSHTGPRGRGVPALLEPIQTPVEKVSDPEWSTAADLPASPAWRGSCPTCLPATQTASALC